MDKSMRPVKYSDGNFSREVEEDYETNCLDDLDAMCACCGKHEARIPKTTRVRDQLDNLRKLVSVCILALYNRDFSDEYRNRQIAGVLVDYVSAGIEKASEDLKNI
jgi:hypothetical protein